MSKVLPALALFVLLFSSVGMAQFPDLRIQKVEVKDSLVVVTYELIGDSDSQYDIEVYLVSPKNPTLRKKLGSLVGDVGPNVKPGGGKSFIWESRRDLSHPRAGEEFQLELQYGNSPSGGIPWYYYAGGGVALAVGAYFIVRPPPPDDNPVTKVTIPQVPIPPARP
jgi:hypothetical protein